MNNIFDIYNGERAESARKKINDNFATLLRKIEELSVVKPKSVKYVVSFGESGWDVDKTLYIPFDEHKCENPSVTVYGHFNNKTQLVFTEVSIDGDNNITLSTDLIFSGKVVIV